MRLSDLSKYFCIFTILIAAPLNAEDEDTIDIWKKKKLKIKVKLEKISRTNRKLCSFTKQ